MNRSEENIAAYAIKRDQLLMDLRDINLCEFTVDQLGAILRLQTGCAVDLEWIDELDKIVQHWKAKNL